MDPIEKAKANMGAVQRTLSGLPGVKGYQEKEMRRSADKQVRDAFADELKTRRDRLTSLQHDLLASGGLLWMDDMERVVGRTQLLIDRVRTASYGYAPFFDLQQVKEEQLDKLIASDRALFESLPALDQAIGDLEKAVRANDAIQPALQAVASLLSDTTEKFARREAAMHAE